MKDLFIFFFLEGEGSLLSQGENTAFPLRAGARHSGNPALVIQNKSQSELSVSKCQVQIKGTCHTPV